MYAGFVPDAGIVEVNAGAPGGRAVNDVRYTLSAGKPIITVPGAVPDGWIVDVYPGAPAGRVGVVVMK